jgi:sugar phosphate isomerase/epimerase
MMPNQTAGDSGGKPSRRCLLQAASALAAAAVGGDLGAQKDGPRPPRASVAQFSLAHLTVLGCAPPEMTYIAARAGYDFVSYRLIAMRLPGEPVYALSKDKAMLRQTRTALAATGLKVSDVELARIQDGVDLQSYVPELEVATELGARQVITSIWTPQWNYAIDRLGQLCDIGKRLGLTMNLEFVTWADVSNLQHTLAICRAVNRPNIGVLIDVLHFSRSRVRPEELKGVPRGWFHVAHICDAPKEVPATKDGLIHTGREERLYPGEGAIDIDGILSHMPDVVYSLEIPNLVRAKELGYAEHAFRCLAMAKNYFAAHVHAQRK